MRRLIPPLLREGEFGRFWTGQTISLFGDQVSGIAIPLTGVLVLHADAAQPEADDYPVEGAASAPSV